MNEQLFASELAKALAPLVSGQSGGSKGYRYGIKADGTPSETAYLYEAGGLFGRCDGSAQLINAMVGPMGFEAVMQWTGTNTEKEFVDAWTSISEVGAEQTAACGSCTSPALQMCTQLYCFGRFCSQTDELQFDRLGVRDNANVPVKALFGDITDATGNVLVRRGEQITDAFMLQMRVTAYLQRLKNSTMLWNGNCANNVGRIYNEYDGFQKIVNTGKFDAYTQSLCPGADSFLLDYQNNAVQSDGSLAITNYFRRMVLQFMTRAGGAGFDWATSQMYIVMTPNMWDCVAKAYACAGIDLCSVGNATGTRVSQDARQAQDRYEEYLSRMALPIYGRWYPVILDNLIPETPGQANGICSDIYFLTTDVNGETVTYGQYQDFNMTYGRIRNELVSMFGSDDIAITDNGRFALIRDNSRGCFDVQILTKPRIVAKMPWLLGRLQNVCCDIPGEPVPDVTGSGRVYEDTGGRTLTPLPTLYGCTDC
jgi:hypothetical protein